MTELPDGRVVTEFRGAYTLDLIREDGATIDELDASGALRGVVAADEDSAEVTLEGPSLIFPFEGEEQIFADAGLPGLSYFTRGEVTLTIEAPEGVTTAVTADIDARIIDLCARFDGDRHHRDEYRDRHHRQHGDEHGDQRRHAHEDGHGDGHWHHGHDGAKR